ncbi:MAG TPA: hypothetical protein VJ508_14160, partial [Saprospiraceae bacterium]|nr:hypothetical protein [Saprospiraceae bacterium]
VLGMTNNEIIEYLLRDQFITPDAAPISAPRTCEPGPGSLVVTDTSNKLSIADGVLTKSATGTTKLLSSIAYARSQGLAFYCRLKLTIGNGHGSFGLSADGTNLIDGLAPYIGSANAVDNTVAAGYAFLAQIAGTFYDVLIVQRSLGAFVFIRGGSLTGGWHLFYPCFSSNGSSYKLMLKSATGADTGVADDFVVTQLSGPLSTDFGFATHYTANPTSPATCTASRLSLVEFTWTAKAGETLDIHVHQIDSNNRITVRCSQAGSTIKIFEKVTGTETERASAAQTWTVDGVYKIVVFCHLYGVRVSVNAAFKVQRDTLINEFGTGYGISGFTVGSTFAVYDCGKITSFPKPFN